MSRYNAGLSGSAIAGPMGGARSGVRGYGLVSGGANTWIEFLKANKGLNKKRSELLAEYRALVPSAAAAARSHKTSGAEFERRSAAAKKAAATRALHKIQQELGVGQGLTSGGQYRSMLAPYGEAVRPVGRSSQGYYGGRRMMQRGKGLVLS